MKLIDQLIIKTMELKSPVVVGLDPIIGKIPSVYYQPYVNNENELEKVGSILFDFNKDIIDAIYKIVPAIKPQIAFYEMYGSYGILAFEKTVAYAKSKGLIVIEDGKRNDIGNTALAYAKGHLGQVETVSGESITNFGVDFLTVSPYLGKESLEPFVDVCIKNDKGIFVLVKTSNPGNQEIQDVQNVEGVTIAEVVARYLASKSMETIGQCGYSAIGAVVGATYPAEAKKLRAIMKNNLFLVPGYGTQGGSAKDSMACFNEDGLGAMINASRSIIFGYEKNYSQTKCTKEQYKDSVQKLAKEMQKDIYTTLKATYKDMKY